jgi:hypothetical protein
LSFGEEIRAARHRKGWSQRELAVAIGVDQNRIYLWESGRIRPSDEKLGDLESTLGPIRSDVVAPGDFDAGLADSPPPTPAPAKDKPPNVKKAAAKKPASKAGMPPLAVQLEIPYHLAAAATRARLPHTSAALDVCAGPCAQAWDQFLMRYPKLREKIEQGAVAADVVNLIYAHMPIVTAAREEIAAQQAMAFPTDDRTAA